MKRNVPFDIARVLCTLWIVGIWHTMGMWNKHLSSIFANHDFFENITVAVLACFTFLSGYFIKKYTFRNRNDVIVFYKKRFWRFYILFVAACLGIYLLTIMENGFRIDMGGVIILIMNIFGLSILIPPSLPTMWYFSMLVFFYLLTPLLLWKYKSSLIKYGLAIIITSVFLFLSYKKITDERLGLYFPLYLVGLFVPNRVVDIITSWKIAVPLLLLFVISLFFYQLIDLRFLYAFAGTISILFVSNMLHFKIFDKVIEILAYSTMCVYLFHRIMIPINNKCLGLFWPNGLSILGIIISITLFFVIGYIIQKIYDITLNRINVK